MNGTNHLIVVKETKFLYGDMNTISVQWNEPTNKQTNKQMKFERTVTAEYIFTALIKLVTITI